jgi:prolyl-tRNA synthetase
VVINLKVGDAGSDAAAERLYADFLGEGIDALYDDRDQGAGGKFAAADLIGVPYQVIVGPRGLKDGTVEIKHRQSGERETLSIEEAVGRVKSLIVPNRRDSL